GTALPCVPRASARYGQVRASEGRAGRGTIESGKGDDVTAEDGAAAKPGRLPALDRQVPQRGPDQGGRARLPGVFRRLQAHVRAGQGRAARTGDPAGDRGERYPG